MRIPVYIECEGDFCDQDCPFHIVTNPVTNQHHCNFSQMDLELDGYSRGIAVRRDPRCMDFFPSNGARHI
jgi:hypothetical protein